MQNLAYLADIFQKLNELNLALQGRRVNIFFAAEKINAMKRKLEVWAVLIAENRFDSFPLLRDFLDETNFTADESLKSEMVDHLVQLRANLEAYFPTVSLADSTAFDWVRNPFGATTQFALTASQNEQLVDLQHSSHLEERFASQPMAEFWASIASTFPDLSKLALRILVPFVSTYLCETGFSVYAATKNKYRNRLDAENDMRVQLSERSPDFMELSKNSQYQSSH